MHPLEDTPNDMDSVDLHYHYIINKLENEKAKLLKDKERLDWLLNYEGNYWLLSNREEIDEKMAELGK